MHCTHCGKPILPDTRFCPACGTPVAPQAAAWQGSTPPPPYAAPRPALLRPRHGRMIGGVCAAIARHYGWNVSLVRILLVLLTPFHLGLGFVAYVVAWVLIPQEPYLIPTAPPPPGTI